MTKGDGKTGSWGGEEKENMLQFTLRLRTQEIPISKTKLIFTRSQMHFS